MTIAEMKQDVIDNEAWYVEGFRPDLELYWALISKPGIADPFFATATTPERAFAAVYEKFVSRGS